MLGLPDGVRACLFDLDGVLTKTAAVHAAAWKEMFDDFLRSRGEGQAPFDIHDDYDTYVDGKSRLDGVRDFLASRHINLSDDEVRHLGDVKNDIVLRRIRDDGVQAYDGSVAYVKAAKAAGLRRAVVSSSANCRDVLVAAGILDLFEDRVDGVVAEREHLEGKPAPDTFLAGARLLGVDASAAAVFEDALAGVAAGRAGRFGYVVGVDRAGQADALRAHGADRVVADLAELMEHTGPGGSSAPGDGAGSGDIR
ncbi:MAG TPA: beta-phosphoglucomutase family hydrolase [Acidimicrobiales bacterium]|jgi:beta-phosphoglucomutase family hydrolase|nr:beta-phosphoglucomutase family hydrolase [Acidimicrobiales bacterium]